MQSFQIAIANQMIWHDEEWNRNGSKVKCFFPPQIRVKESIVSLREERINTLVINQEAEGDNFLMTWLIEKFSLKEWI